MLQVAWMPQASWGWSDRQLQFNTKFTKPGAQTWAELCIDMKILYASWRVSLFALIVWKPFADVHVFALCSLVIEADLRTFNPLVVIAWHIHVTYVRIDAKWKGMRGEVFVLIPYKLRGERDRYLSVSNWAIRSHGRLKDCSRLHLSRGTFSYR